MPDVRIQIMAMDEKKTRYETAYFVADVPVMVNRKPLTHYIETMMSTPISAINVVVSLNNYFPDQLLQAAKRLVMTIGNATIKEAA